MLKIKNLFKMMYSSYMTKLFQGFDISYLDSCAEDIPPTIFCDDGSSLRHYGSCGDIVGCCSC